MESKSKQEASKINEQNEIKFEIKNKSTSNDLECVKSQKNMEDIPVLQKNYNDQPDRYDLWLHGKDIGPHSEESGQTAAPMSSLTDLSCNNSRNSELLHSYLNTILKNKQYTIDKKKSIANPSVNISEFINVDILPDVKKDLQELENEEQEDQQVEIDEQQFDWFEYMVKDTWLKVGEISEDQSQVEVGKQQLEWFKFLEFLEDWLKAGEILKQLYVMQESRKRKKTQTEGKKKIPKMVSKSEQETNKINMQDLNVIKSEIKDEIAHSSHDSISSYGPYYANISIEQTNVMQHNPYSVHKEIYPLDQIILVPSLQSASPSKSANNFQNTNVPMKLEIKSVSNSKQTTPRITENSPRRRSQKGTSHVKKSSLAKNNELNNNVCSRSNISIETQVRTQVSDPAWISRNISNLNSLSHNSNIQNTSQKLHHELNKHLNISDSKLQDLQKQTGNICLSAPKQVKRTKELLSILRKPKEKEVIIKRKPAASTSTSTKPIVPVKTSANIASINAPTTVASTPTDIVSVAAATTTAVVSEIENTKEMQSADQTQSAEQAQSADVLQFCSSQSTSLILGHISEMIYPSEQNNEQLKAFNDHWSAQVPHCAICTIFISHTNKNSRMMPPDCKSTTLSKWKLIWDVFVFANSKEQATEAENNKLLRCRECHVTVHASCYGIIRLPTDILNWICDMCKAGRNVRCCLCPIFGGPLKRTSDGRWAHILCTLMIPETTFKDTINEDPINVLAKNLYKKECCFCRQQNGACVKCNQCNNWLHPSCGFVAGATFTLPLQYLSLHELQVTCNGHNKGERKLPPICQGETVWAKHRNARYYQAIVKAIKTKISYIVKGNTYIYWMPPTDINNYDPGNTPLLGASVTMQHTIDETHKTEDCIFGGIQREIIFTVIFEDDSELDLKRNDIYSLQEVLPKGVRSRLSVATEMKYRTHFYNTEDETEAKDRRIKEAKNYY